MTLTGISRSNLWKIVFADLKKNLQFLSFYVDIIPFALWAGAFPCGPEYVIIEFAVVCLCVFVLVSLFTLIWLLPLGGINSCIPCKRSY